MRCGGPSSAIKRQHKRAAHGTPLATGIESVRLQGDRRDMPRDTCNDTAPNENVRRSHGEGKTVATKEDTLDPIRLIRLDERTVHIPIVGVTPVIPHKWSEKSLRMMRESQSGNKARAKHAPKVAEEEAEAATYRLADGRPGMPATAFKAAIVGACRLFKGITLVQAKQSFFVVGEGPDQLVPIEGDATLREDTPRNATGVADLRYRYAYWPWSATLPVAFLPSVVDLDSVIALVAAAGTGGVGDWRPSAPKSLTGTFGRFTVPDVGVDNG
jgi:hypothetical protein